MSEFLAFMGGALFGVALMCCLQINRLADHRKKVEDAETKCPDTFQDDRGRSGIPL